MTELCYLGASEALALFEKRELSPVELLDAVVARTEAVNGAVNAVTERMYDEARAAALESERRWAGQGGAPRPLEGIPLALKEEQPIAGRTLEEGSLLEKGAVAEHTHPVVTRVSDAGAVVHLRTTTPEFSCAAFTHSRLWGVTRNPWNLEASPGGSSGGSGAALAAGMTTLATGSDIGGSIRIPASFNGLVGFKPPFGRVPGMPPYNQDTYCADGPMGRSVADVALLQNVLAGPWAGDQASLRPAYVLARDGGDVAGLRVAVCPTLGDFPVASSIVANLQSVAEALAGQGAVVDQVELPWTSETMMAAAMAHFGAIFGAAVGAMVAEHGDLLTPYAVAFAEQTAQYADTETRLGGLVAETEIYTPLGLLLEDYDVLLAPTCGAEMYVAGDDYTESTVDVDGAAYGWQQVMLTLPFNVVGRVPVLAVPSGIAPNGVPTGVQIVGRTYDDQTVFTVGAAVERALRWWSDPTWRPSAVPSAT